MMLCPKCGSALVSTPVYANAGPGGRTWARAWFCPNGDYVTLEREEREDSE